MTILPAGLLRLEARGERHADERTGDWFEDVTLVLYDVDRVEHILIQSNLELGPILEWLKANELNIRNDLPPLDQRGGETIGQTLCRAYDVIPDNISDDLSYIAFDALYQYNSKHNFSFGTPGMEVPRVLIGRGQDGLEVCNWIHDDTDTPWRYLFDADDFFGNLPTLESLTAE